jgi:sulfite dehydrogenase (cytochrome) subunit B
MRLSPLLGAVSPALLLILVGPASSAGAASSAAPVAAAAEVTNLREGPGRDLTVGRCAICHSVEYIPSNAPAMNRTAWQKSIEKMKDKFGAPITDEEAKQILDYLDANYSGKSG